MRWGIVGAGLIGNKRAVALSQLGETMVSVANLHEERAIALAAKYGLKHYTDYKSVTRDPAIDAVVVATTHDALSEITVDALQHGKHVLVEKPAGRNPSEVQAVVDAERKSGKMVCVGFNHRFHPAMLEAREICRSGKYGRLLFMRGRYGHGGRLGYEKEWRLDPKMSGGGQLIDQGSHLIDLSRFFSGTELELTHSMLKSYFWRAPAEDTGLLVLEGRDGTSATLFTSCMQWKNLFSFELFFERAQVNVDGLGRSYGTETLTVHEMRPELGPPDTKAVKFEGEDGSFRAETEDFIGKINGKPSLCATAGDALASISIIDAAYRKGKEKQKKK
ncbi:MAG: Gfo/Idh/MocA family oxidoreductase [Candidatus Micrarchaeia archaeon]|jgi:predicted dehydrogenase